MKRLLLVPFVFLLGLTVAFAANESSPLPMLQKTSDQLIAQLQKNKSKLKSNPQIIDQLVDQYIVPRVLQTQMARSVVSRDNWNKATLVQRAAFQSEFKTLVIRTYASAFANYTDQTVQYMPIRGGVGNQTNVKVNSVIMRSDAPSIPVTYLVKKTSGKWMVYDFSVDGVSMVNSFRSQIASMNADSLAAVTKMLKQHNSGTRS